MPTVIHNNKKKANVSRVKAPKATKTTPYLSRCVKIGALNCSDVDCFLADVLQAAFEAPNAALYIKTR